MTLLIPTEYLIQNTRQTSPNTQFCLNTSLTKHVILSKHQIFVAFDFNSVSSEFYARKQSKHKVD